MARAQTDIFEIVSAQSAEKIDEFLKEPPRPLRRGRHEHGRGGATGHSQVTKDAYRETREFVDAYLAAHVIDLAAAQKAVVNAGADGAARPRPKR